jgi:hypothetical protein
MVATRQAAADVTIVHVLGRMARVADGALSVACRSASGGRHVAQFGPRDRPAGRLEDVQKVLTVGFASSNLNV